MQLVQRWAATAARFRPKPLGRSVSRLKAPKRQAATQRPQPVQWSAMRGGFAEGECDVMAMKVLSSADTGQPGARPVEVPPLGRVPNSGSNDKLFRRITHLHFQGGTCHAE